MKTTLIHFKILSHFLMSFILPTSFNSKLKHPLLGSLLAAASICSALPIINTVQMQQASGYAAIALLIEHDVERALL
jgi:hypothetical protein